MSMQENPQSGNMPPNTSPRHRVKTTLDSINRGISSSFFGRFWRLEGSGHPDEIANSNAFRELRAGITTFATMAYIIAVNASIISQSGGPCPCDLEDRFGCDAVEGYTACKEDVRRDLITATAAVSGLSTVIFGLFTNLPVAIAPGMGLNAYFAFQVVGYNGSGNISYSVALTAIFIEGLVFLFLALTGLRQWLVKLIPASLKTATGVGIGLFLAEIGLSYSAGIGAITGGWKATPLMIAGCPAEMIDPDSHTCTSGVMSSPKLWMALLAGGVFTAYLMAFRVRFAFIIGIILVSVLSWPRDTAVTYFPHNEEGDARFNFFKQVVSRSPMKYTLNALDWNISEQGAHFAIALFTFLYVDIIDTTATLYAMVGMCGRVDRDGDFPRSTVAYSTDALCISMSSLFGCSPVTAFIESSSGIAEGGRTGLTAVVTGVCFLLSIPFAPILASIPPWATGCTLVIVGCLMIRQVTHINWAYVGDFVPSFVVVIFIPFSYSVAYGIIAGMLTYAVLNTLIALTVRITGGRIEPREYDSKEHWTLKPPGKKPWFIRAARRWGPFRGSSEKQEGTPAHVTDENILLSSSRSGTSDQKQGFNEPITVPMRVLRSASLSE